jgi:hypothetical protein
MRAGSGELAGRALDNEGIAKDEERQVELPPTLAAWRCVMVEAREASSRGSVESGGESTI